MATETNVVFELLNPRVSDVSVSSEPPPPSTADFTLWGSAGKFRIHLDRPRVFLKLNPIAQAALTQESIESCIADDSDRLVVIHEARDELPYFRIEVTKHDDRMCMIRAQEFEFSELKQM